MADQQRIESGDGKIFPQFLLATEEVHSLLSLTGEKGRSTEYLAPKGPRNQSLRFARYSVLAPKHETAGLTGSSGRRLQIFNLALYV
jgi:hypothetical protein